MTGYVVNDYVTNVGSNNYAFRFGGNGDSLYVTKLGQIIVGDTGFNATAVDIVAGTSNSVTVAGEVRGYLNGISFGTGIGSVNVLAGGTVSSYVRGVLATGALSVSNAGEIRSETDDAILANARLNLVNSGTISGELSGIFAAGRVAGSTATISNSGSIVGVAAQAVNLFVVANLINSGTISGTVGVEVGAGGTFVNSGLIQGTDRAAFEGTQFGLTNQASGVISCIGDGVSAGTGVIDNAGVISGGVNGISANFALTLDNSGTITGISGAAVITNASADSVTNDGLLSGNVLLGGGNDLYDGGGGRVRGSINLGAGDDIGIGGAASETFTVGTLTALDGDDDIDAGGGSDTLDLSGAGGAVRVNLLTGLVRGALVGTDTVANFERVITTGFNDRVTAGTGAASVQSGSGNDTVNGGGAADILTCGAGNDTASGGAGGDRINGGAGVDTLNGAQGNDLVIGGADADILTGGTEADTFLFRTKADFRTGTTATIDRITDFVSGTDIIDLSGVDAQLTVAGDQDFTFIGTGAFTASGQVRAVTSGTTTTVWICDDFAGAPTGISAITLTGVTTLTGLDFDL